ncbi:MAG: NAD(P)-binding protein [Sphingomonadales bacterium]
MKITKNKRAVKLSANISRRDFVNGTLVGVGAALLSSTAPLYAAAKKKTAFKASDPWTGYAGVGDYAKSNGNIASVRDAAHLIRDGFTEEMVENAGGAIEEYDMVVVGGGFSGIGAAYKFHKTHGQDKNCLIIENHPIFGGEAKQNEFEVDGHMLYGPQGSNDFGPPNKDDDDLIGDIYRDTGLPFGYDFVKQDYNKTKIRAPLENYYGMFWEEERYDTGYFFGKDAKTPWVINPKADKLARIPWPQDLIKELNNIFDDKKDYYDGDDFDHWLDSMSYKDLIENVMGYSPKVTEYFDPIIAISMGGVGGDVYSAYSAKLLDMPGTRIRYKYDKTLTDKQVGAFSFPGGNTGIFRHIVKYLIPNSIQGVTGFEETLFNPINFKALDRPENPLKIRLNSTVIDVSHDGDPGTASHVNITYTKDGKVRRVKARSVVISVGGWVAKHIVSDMPEEIYEAYSQFYHSPVLVVNVALRNWRFLDKLGISSGRWFRGFGDFFSIRRPMVTGDNTQPFDPDKPVVMTFYAPFNNPGHSPAEQGSIGRNELLGKSYADYEKEITEQMTDMFGMAGFNAKEDIAAIVLNRWGHAYISPQPGFHFGKDGKEAPKETVKRGFGRIQFGHSELSGYMSHTRALNQGAQAAEKVMQKL